jgi:hypothetical protein
MAYRLSCITKNRRASEMANDHPEIALAYGFLLPKMPLSLDCRQPGS